MTTSSVQFGAHVELHAGIDGFGIKGHLDFDALFVFDPFGFMIDFSAGVSVECADFSVASIELSGHLSGTSPWRIRGHASISILWWDVDVDIPEITWGDANPPPLPPARDPAAVLAHELGVPGNWAALSREVPHLVQLRPGVDVGHVALHPLAEFGFTQTAVPVDLPLQRMDGVKLGAPVTLRVESKEPPAPVQHDAARSSSPASSSSSTRTPSSRRPGTRRTTAGSSSTPCRRASTARSSTTTRTTRRPCSGKTRRWSSGGGSCRCSTACASGPDTGRRPPTSANRCARTPRSGRRRGREGDRPHQRRWATSSTSRPRPGAASTTAAAQAMSAATDLYAGQAQAMVDALAASRRRRRDLQVVHAWEVQ